LGSVNVLLGFFNMIPAFPMDGGRVFRVLLAEKLNFSDATKYAAFIGRLLGVFMDVFGIYYNPWLIIIGVFVYIGAAEEAETTIFSITLARVRVKDVTYPEVAAITPETTVADALETMLKARFHDALIEKDGSLLGIVTWSEIMKIRSERRSIIRVEELPVKHVSAFDDESILEAYKLMSREKLDLVPVVSRRAPTKVGGVVTSEGVAHAYEKAKSLR
jgi:CBS domain-containing protein